MPAAPASCCAAQLIRWQLLLNNICRYGRHADAILDFTTVLNTRPRFANARFRRAFSYKYAARRELPLSFHHHA
jgi:hypothetical protein